MIVRADELVVGDVCRVTTGEGAWLRIEEVRIGEDSVQARGRWIWNFEDRRGGEGGFGCPADQPMETKREGMQGRLL